MESSSTLAKDKYLLGVMVSSIFRALCLVSSFCYRFILSIALMFAGVFILNLAARNEALRRSLRQRIAGHFRRVFVTRIEAEINEVLVCLRDAGTDDVKQVGDSQRPDLPEQCAQHLESARQSIRDLVGYLEPRLSRADSSSLNNEKVKKKRKKKQGKGKEEAPEKDEADRVQSSPALSNADERDDFCAKMHRIGTTLSLLSPDGKEFRHGDAC
jgi:hypothetical protein